MFRSAINAVCTVDSIQVVDEEQQVKSHESFCYFHIFVPLRWISVCSDKGGSKEVTTFLCGH